MSSKVIADIYPLSPLQEGILYHYISEPESRQYFEQKSILAEGELDPALLEQAWNFVIEEYEVLRTIFRWEGVEKPVQIVLQSRPLQLRVYDLRDLQQAEQEIRLKEICEQDLQQGFDLARGPLVRLAFCRLGLLKQMLIWSDHHIILDGWSVGIGWNALFQAYDRLRQGQQPQSASPVCYREYIRFVQNQDREKAQNFWQGYLADFAEPTYLPPLDLRVRSTTANRESLESLDASTDTVAGGSASGRKAEQNAVVPTYHLAFSPESSEKLRRVAIDAQVTVNQIVQALWGILLQRYNNTDDVVFGATVAGRPAELPGVQESVGLFINTVPVRIRALPGETFLQLIARFKTESLERNPFEYLALSEIKKLSEIAGQAPFFDNIFVYENYPIDEFLREPIAGIKILEITSHDQTNFDLCIVASFTDHLVIKLLYNDHRFDWQAMELLARHFENLLYGVLANVEAPVDGLEILSGFERQAILQEFSGSKNQTAYPKDCCVHELFEAEVARGAERIAVTLGSASLTYGELNEAANRVAWYLRRQGIGPDHCVALLTERSFAMIIGMLAILKAGGAYLPLDPSQPAARTTFMLADANVKWLLVEEALAPMVPGEFTGEVLALESLLQTDDVQNLPVISRSDSLAYIMYTSGSTGQPKGTMICQYAITRLVRDTNYITLTENDRVLALSTYTFDGSTFDIWAALLNGARLVLGPKDLLLTPWHLGELLAAEGVTVTFMATALFNSLADGDLDIFLHFRKLLIGGERLSVAHLARVYQKVGPGVLANVYGPTETTTFATWYPLEHDPAERASIPIGRPIANAQAYILDRWMRPVPVGVVGELYIGGDGLARGYLNRPDLTVERFLLSPFVSGERLYKTGDLARWLADGNIEFHGRIDQQVKVRGFRIEPAEIESLLVQHPQIKEACVLDRVDGRGEKYLCAYIVQDGELPISAVQNYLLENLPEYMVPAAFVALERLPLTPNGKVDRKVLPVPAGEGLVDTQYVPPVTSLEGALTTIWAEVLGVDRVGMNDNFFELGGHSLKATQMVARIKKVTDLHLSIRELFEYPTPAGVVSLLEGRDNAASGAGGGGVARGAGDAGVERSVGVVSGGGVERGAGDAGVERSVGVASGGVDNGVSVASETGGVTLLSEADGVNKVDAANLASSDIATLPEREYYDVSVTQRRLWLLHQLESGSNAYNISGTHELGDALDKTALEKTLQTIVDRHESLRTTFVEIDGALKQRIHPTLEIPLQVVDLRNEINPAKLFRDTMLRDSQAPFDLATGPLLKIVLFEFADERNVILFVLHHIIADGWSLQVLAGEFAELYAAYRKGQANPLAPLRIQYRDFAAWQNQFLASPAVGAHREYWLLQLEGAVPVQNLPVDYLYGQQKHLAGARYTFTLPVDVHTKLRELAGAEKASLFIVLLTGFTAFLAQLSGLDDIAIAAPVAGREHDDLKGLIGCFLNTVIFRNTVQAEENFQMILQRVKTNTLAALEYQSYPFELLSDELQLKRAANQPGLTSILFNLLNFGGVEQALPTMPMGHASLDQDMKFDLGLIVSEHLDGIFFDCQYRTGLFAAPTIQYLMDEYKLFLEKVAANPTLPLKAHGLFSPQRIQVPGNTVQPVNSYSEFTRKEIEQTVVSRFEEQVKRYPDKLAIQSTHAQLTYAELNHSANRVARKILDKCDPASHLSTDEQIRYTRQMMIEGWGIDAQEKLKKTRVFVAGAGGSGSPVIMQLALLGVGTIVICDNDVVELSNLNRQVLHDLTRIGMNKAVSARLTVNRINPHVQVIVHEERITRENVDEMVQGAAVIFDNVDDMEAKFILSECAVRHEIPQIISSMMDLNSYAAVLYAPRTPCFHCLYDRDKLTQITTWRETVKNQKKAANPVAAPALFLSTGFACNEAVKIILGIGNPAYNKYLLFNQRGDSEIAKSDGYLAITYPFSEHFRQISREQGFDWDKGWRGQFVEELAISPDPNCPVCGKMRKHAPSTEVREGATTVESELQGDAGAEESQAAGRVALLFEHGAGMIVGMLGALKAGKVYVPLDPTYPEERLLYMIKDAEVSLIITNERNLAYAHRLVKAAEGYIKVLNIDDMEVKIVADNLQLPIKPDQLAYILYTSGSTGQPKGVMQNHRNILHFICTYTNNLRISAADRLTLFSSYSFDAAVMDIYGALLNGATLYPYFLKEMSMDNLARRLREDQITIYHSIPAIFRHLTTSLSEGIASEISKGQDYGNETIFSTIRLVVMGGDTVFRHDVQAFKQYFNPDAIFINGLGPTESTVTLQYFVDHATVLTGATVPVGYPVDETEVLLLDETGSEVAVFAIGEIVYKSPYLALGYWQKPEITASTFGLDPRTGEGRVYRSGDLGRRRQDGSIEFVGRNDFQVKVRGFRVDLGEAESVLQTHPAVKEAAVVAKEAAIGAEGAALSGRGAMIGAEEAAPSGRGAVIGAEEAALSGRETAVGANEGSAAGKYLVAYVALKEEVSEGDLRNFLLQQLPEYMVPVSIVRLDSLPLTPTKKIDRRALMALKEAERAENVQYVGPKNAVEQTLTRLWSHVLGLEPERISVQGSFFDLGGNSLTVMRLATLIRQEFNRELKIQELFNYPTIEQQAEFIHAQATDSQDLIEHLPERECYPASSAQKRIFVLHQIDSDNLSYNLPMVLVIDGELNHERFVEAVQKLVCRHESLRTSFELVNGEVLQKVHPVAEVSVEFSALADSAAEEQVEGIIKQFIRPFDLTLAPLFRVHLLSWGEKHVAMFDMHHIISDGLSRQILNREFVQLYEGTELPRLRIQYRDFAHWQNQFFASTTLKRQEEYWLEQFTPETTGRELPVLNLSLDFPRPQRQSFVGEQYHFVICEELAHKLQQLSRQSGVTLFMTLLAAYSLLLARYCNQEDVIIGSPIAGRHHSDLENLVGIFINTLALRTMPVGSKPFTHFLQEVRTQVLGAFDNQDYPFENLVEKLNLARDMSRNPLFDTMFRLQNFLPQEVEEKSIKCSPYPFETKAVQFDLQLTCVEFRGRINGTFEYCTSLFQMSTIQQMAEHLIHLLEEITAGPEKTLADLNLLSPAERQRLVYGYNETKLTYPRDLTYQQVFEAQVEKTPDKVALTVGGQTLTYRELNERANSLAEHLRQMGVGRETVVGLMASRSIELIVGMLGIIKAGGAYLPIDPEYPAMRIQYVLEDSEAAVLLTQRSLMGKLVPERPADAGSEEQAESQQRAESRQYAESQEQAESQQSAESQQQAKIRQAAATSSEKVETGTGYTGKVVFLDDQPLYTGPKSNPVLCNLAQDALYLIYTSGSTGMPKGTIIEHRAVLNFMAGMGRQIAFAAEKPVLSLTTISFDIFVLETLLPLSLGAHVVLATEMEQRDPHFAAELMATHGVQMIQLTPSRLHIFLENQEAQAALAGLSEICVGGEAFPESLLHRLQALTPARIYNMYGPTETTVWSTVSDVTDAHTVTIGKPIANTRVYILDANLTPVPEIVVGALYIAGDGLARGYHQRPEMTAERFIRDPFVPGERMYRTGDLARWLPGGVIEYVGREDYQVKIRGYRIETGEIEALLDQYPGIKGSAVVSRDAAQGFKYLAAYYVADSELATPALRSYLLAHVPEYMVPGAYIRMDEFPLTPNGKVDRRALPDASEVARPALLQDFVAPRTGSQIQIAAVWQEVLNIAQVGLNDNFFDLGGNSLLLVQMHAKLDKLFPDELSIADLFAYPTIARLSEYIEMAAATDEQAEKARVYWENELAAGYELLTLPAAYYRHGEEEETGVDFTVHLDERRTVALRNVAQGLGVELQDILTSLYLYLFTELAGKTDILIEVALKPTAIRQRSEHSRAMNHLFPLRIDVAGIEDLAQLFKLVSDKFHAADEFATYPIPTVIGSARPESLVPLLLWDKRGMYPNDIIFRVSVRADGMVVDCHFNEGKIAGSKVSNLVKGYLTLIEMLLKEYAG